MRGIVSFHPIDPAAFTAVLDRLLAGQPVDPNPLLDAACRFKKVALTAARYGRAIERLIQDSTPPPLPTEGPLWLRLKARLDQFDHRPDPLAVRLSRRIDSELHLHGRPFFITEGSAEAVAAVLDEYVKAGGIATVEATASEQLARLDPDAARNVRPDGDAGTGADLPYRSKLSSAVKRLADLARKVRRDASAGPTGFGARDDGAIATEIAWRALYLHARATPFWIARDVDGLDTICKMARVAPPDFLVPPFELFESSLGAIPSLRGVLGVDLRTTRCVGAYVPPRNVLALLDFLHANGARIIQAAAKEGEGPACATLMHKIRECAAYASRHGMGYLEAAGIDRVEDDFDPERDADGAGLMRLLGDEVGAALVTA